MRISKNDRLFNVYSAASTPNAEGYQTVIYTKAIDSMGGDLQPIGSKIDPAMYGINSNPADVKQLFFNTDNMVSLGYFIDDLTDGVTYLVKGLHVWYSHKEAILEPIEVIIP